MSYYSMQKMWLLDKVMIFYFASKMKYPLGHEKAQLMTDPSQVNLINNQLSIYDKFYQCYIRVL